MMVVLTHQSAPWFAWSCTVEQPVLSVEEGKRGKRRREGGGEEREEGKRGRRGRKGGGEGERVGGGGGGGGGERRRRRKRERGRDRGEGGRGERRE